MLEVKAIDWHLLENGKEHHTDRYEIIHVESTPVLRRSQPFKISITFNRAFDEATDRVRLFFNHEKKKFESSLHAMLVENTTVTSSNKINKSTTKWSHQIDGQQKEKLTLLVRSPPTAAWGIWNLTIKLSSKLDTKVNTWKSPTTFWLLFNPWDKDDDVFMPEMKYLDEYILNDVGKVYVSSAKKPKGMIWIYGQFAAPILKVVKEILDRSNPDEAQLSSPVHVCKSLTDVSEILKGNWDGPFDDGTAPWLWTGSLPIFEEYYKTKLPVKYAQCFVFAGVFTAALRAVGIPARNVTNFISSTIGEYTMSVNYIFDSNGESIESPMIWNFHVWNDIWMARPDLPTGFGGWQAIDCMRGGPASLAAIKKGEICQPFHAGIIMAECNSDRVRWTRDSNGENHLVELDKDYIGKAMLTKRPFIYDPHGDTDFEDVKHLYKEPEGSKEERMAVYNAVISCKRGNRMFDELVKDHESDDPEYYEWMRSRRLYPVDLPETDETVLFKLREIESVIFGEQFIVILIIGNLRETPITVEANLGSSTTYYNGATAGLIKREIKSTTIAPKSEGAVSLIIQPEEYAAKLVEFTLLKLHCIATIKENNFVWANDIHLNVEMPEMIISSKEDLILNKEGILLFQFKNQLKTKLTKCSITYEAPGIGRNVKISVRDIKEGEEATIEHKIKPVKGGEIQLNAMLTSKQLTFLSGSATLHVY